MSINGLCFENGCTNLRLNIVTDASEIATCIAAYLLYEALFKLTFAIEKCPVAPIRHMTIPKIELKPQSTEFVSESRYSANMLSELTKSVIRPTHQQCYSCYKHFTVNNKCSLRTEQRKYWKTHRWINGDTSKMSKTLLTLEPEECPSKASRGPYG